MRTVSNRKSAATSARGESLTDGVKQENRNCRLLEPTPFDPFLQGNGQTFSSFDIGGPLTELAQLANLATLVEGPIEYDTLSGKILNSKPASHLLHREYRKGWSL